MSKRKIELQNPIEPAQITVTFLLNLYSYLLSKEYSPFTDLCAGLIEGELRYTQNQVATAINSAIKRGSLNENAVNNAAKMKNADFRKLYQGQTFAKPTLKRKATEEFAEEASPLKQKLTEQAPPPLKRYKGYKNLECREELPSQSRSKTQRKSPSAELPPPALKRAFEAKSPTLSKEEEHYL